MKKQNWDIADRYQNTTRDAMPAEETLTSFENTLVDCARIAIAVQGGGYSEEQGRRFYQVRVEAPANVEPLPTDAELVSYARQHWSPKLAFDLSATGQRAARSAYIAICLGENERLKDENPEAWAAAVKGLRKHPDLLRVLFSASAPGDRVRRAAQQAGLERPAR